MICFLVLGKTGLSYCSAKYYSLVDTYTISIEPTEESPGLIKVFELDRLVITIPTNGEYSAALAYAKQNHIYTFPGGTIFYYHGVYYYHAYNVSISHSDPEMLITINGSGVAQIQTDHLYILPDNKPQKAVANLCSIGGSLVYYKDKLYVYVPVWSGDKPNFSYNLFEIHSFNSYL
ncbi:MAG TPA: hypothetical protein DCY74_04910 [Clostridiales bacterium]|nr:hypothetical protein [Clostridiales bacterium]